MQVIYRTIYQLLANTYGEGEWWPAENPFEVAVGAILTQNTNWNNVEKALGQMRSRSLLSLEAVLAVDEETLRDAVRPSGFFTQKSERLKILATFIQSRLGGNLQQLSAYPLDDIRKELLALKGVGPETADSILLYAGDVPTFVVDAYTLRICGRIGILKKTDYHSVRQEFMENLPKDVFLYKSYHGVIVQHAKARCAKRNPLCAGCCLAEICKRTGV